MTRNYLAAVLAFFLFGLMPIFWNLLSGVDSSRILFHRCLWVFLFLLPYILWNAGYQEIGKFFVKQFGYLMASSVLIAINWLGYIYAVNHGYVFEASLAYYISPILTILLSVVVLKESLTLKQLFALFFVSLAIVYLLVASGVFPLFAGIIALSFAIYGLLGRMMKVPVFIRMLIESFVITLFMLFFLESPVTVFHHFVEASMTTELLLVLAGPFTIAPMGLYLFATKHVKFSTIGMLSFILPTMVFLLGIFYFNEPPDRHKLIAMMLIIPSLILYVMDLRKDSALKEPLKQPSHTLQRALHSQ